MPTIRKTIQKYEHYCPEHGETFSKTYELPANIAKIRFRLDLEKAGWKQKGKDWICPAAQKAATDNRASEPVQPNKPPA